MSVLTQPTAYPQISLPEETPDAPPTPPTPAPVVLAPRKRVTGRKLLLTGVAVVAVGSAVVGPQFLKQRANLMAGGIPFTMPKAVMPSAPSDPASRKPPADPIRAAPLAGPRLVNTQGPYGQRIAAAEPFGARVDTLPNPFQPLTAGEPLAQALAPTPAPAATPAPIVEPSPTLGAALTLTAPNLLSAPATTAAPGLDAIAKALKLVPAPTSTTEEVKLLNLVTLMATQLRTMSEDNAGLRDQVRAMQSSVASRLDDVERRVSFREAQEAVGSMQKTSEQLSSASAGNAGPPQISPMPAQVATVAAAFPAAPGAMTSYRVQGASPRVAILAPTGAGPIKSVQVGSVLDDHYGRILRIRQDGRIWVVEAEHGVLRGGD